MVEEDGGILRWCDQGAEMMLEWAAEQPTEITTTAIDLEFLPTDTNEDRGVQNLEFVLHQMHTAQMVLTSYEANDIVANSRKNPLDAWRRLQMRYEGNETFAHDDFSWTVLSSGTPSGSSAWNPACRVTRKS